MKTPVIIERKPIFVNKKSPSRMGGWYSGGWCVFPKPDEDAPAWRIKKSERILWCPYCGEWTIYNKAFGDDKSVCTGYCGWASTNDYYVKHVNNIWFEDVPLSVLKDVSVPTASKKR